MRSFLIILLALFLNGCRPTPPADLDLVHIIAHPFHYDIYFDTRTDILNIYTNSYMQSPASTALVCSTPDNPYFDISKEALTLGRGDIEMVGTRNPIGIKSYTFKAHFQFFRQLDSEGEQTITVPNAEVKKLLSTYTHIGCKVRITVFIGRTYYSEIMYIETTRILAVTAQLAEMLATPPKDSY